MNFNNEPLISYDKEGVTGDPSLTKKLKKYIIENCEGKIQNFIMPTPKVKIADPPPALTYLLHDFVKAIRHFKPQNLHQFAADYFKIVNDIKNRKSTVELQCLRAGMREISMFNLLAQDDLEKVIGELHRVEPDSMSVESATEVIFVIEHGDHFSCIYEGDDIDSLIYTRNKGFQTTLQRVKTRLSPDDKVWGITQSRFKQLSYDSLIRANHMQVKASRQYQCGLRKKELPSKHWRLLKHSVVDPFADIIMSLSAFLFLNGIPQDVLDNIEWCIERLWYLKDLNDCRRKDLMDKYKVEKEKRISSVSKSGTPVYVLDILKDETRIASYALEIKNFLLNEFLYDTINEIKEEEEMKMKAESDSAKAVNSHTKYVNFMDWLPIKMANSSEMVSTILNHLHWDVDVFQINGFTNGRPLACVTHTIFNERGLFEPYDIDPVILLSFLVKLEESYQFVPYHNSIHAVDVVISVNQLLSAECIKHELTNFEVIATLIACAAHDVNHPGVTNDFICKSKHELARLYNDESVLENFHYDTTCRILQIPECNITKDMSEKKRRQFHSTIKQLILGTDMAKHEGHINYLRIFKKEHDPARTSLDLTDIRQKRVAFLEAVVHTADLANPAKPFHIYETWVQRIFDEFFRQGALEEKMNLPISPLCDPLVTNIYAAQIGFIDYVVNPLYNCMHDIFKNDLKDIVDHIKRNREKVANLIHTYTPRRSVGPLDIHNIEISPTNMNLRKSSTIYI